MSANKSAVITELLHQEGYAVHHHSFDKGKMTDFTNKPHIVIVDTLSLGNEGLSLAIANLVTYFANGLASLPPILALVAIESRKKQQIYQLGADDYLSYPFIVEEIQHRVKQWLACTKLSQFNCDSEADKSAQTLLIPSYQLIDKEYELVKKTAEYLRSQLANEVNLTDLTRKMATNRNKLSGAFKKHFGMTVFHWLRQQRLSQAAELLSKTSLSILQVSEQVGYQDSNNFSTAFRRSFAMSPKQYRSCNRQR